MKMDGYMSPISLSVERIVQDFNEHTDRNVLHAVMQCGINVDRDELIKALRYDRDQYQKGFCDGYDFAQTWISVNERLPETCENVLVFTHGLSDIGYYSPTGRFWICYVDEDARVTHWMPLPKAPKEDYRDA